MQVNSTLHDALAGDNRHALALKMTWHAVIRWKRNTKQKVVKLSFEPILNEVTSMEVDFITLQDVLTGDNRRETSKLIEAPLDLQISKEEK